MVLQVLVALHGLLQHLPPWTRRHDYGNGVSLLRTKDHSISETQVHITMSSASRTDSQSRLSELERRQRSANSNANPRANPNAYKFLPIDELRSTCRSCEQRLVAWRSFEAQDDE